MTHDEVPAYRLTVKIKNNRLWKAIIELFPDVMTQAQASKKLGIDQNLMCTLLNMKRHPFNKHTQKWSPIALKISEALAYPPEYLFDFELYGKAPDTPVLELEYHPQLQLEHTTALMLEAPQEKEAMDAEMEKELKHLLWCLPDREARVIRMLYGIDTEKCSRSEIAERMFCSAQNVAVIEKRAFERLRRMASMGMGGHVSKGWRDNLRSLVEEQEKAKRERKNSASETYYQKKYKKWAEKHPDAGLDCDETDWENFSVNGSFFMDKKL